MNNKNIKFASSIVLAGFVFAHGGFFDHGLAVKEKHIHPEPYTHNYNQSAGSCNVCFIRKSDLA